MQAPPEVHPQRKEPPPPRHTITLLCTGAVGLVQIQNQKNHDADQESFHCRTWLLSCACDVPEIILRIECTPPPHTHTPIIHRGCGPCSDSKSDEQRCKSSPSSELFHSRAWLLSWSCHVPEKISVIHPVAMASCWLGK